MSFLDELKRRNVIRVGIAYAVIAWLIAQVLQLVFQSFATPDWVMKTVLVLLAAGLPLILLFAWAFELTPAGIKRESEIDRSQSVTAQTGRKLNTLIIALMALAIAYLIFDKIYLAPRLASRDAPSLAIEASGHDQQATPDAARAADRLSIAVLPFDNRSDRKEDQFFTDGIHDDLLTSMARIGSLKVISRTSVMEYRGTTKKIPQIAAELGVAHILEGAVQRSGQQVRINVQLIDAKTDEHLWAETYDRELTAENLFAIQSDISTRIAEALQATLSPDEQKRINRMPTANLDAYDAYLHGRQLMATRVTANLQRAVQEFQHAVELDLQFSLAWVGLADSYYLTALYSDSPMADTIAPREDAVARALALDPELGEAYVSLAQIHDYHNRVGDREQAFRKAIELSPNYATAYHWYAVSLRDDPLRSRERLDLLLKAAEFDPRSMIIGSALAGDYFEQGLFSRGEQQALKVIELYPAFPNTHHELVDHYFWDVGEFAKALEQAQALSRIDPDDFDAWRHQIEIYTEVGDFQTASAVQERIAQLNPESHLAAWADFEKAITQANTPAIREVAKWLLKRAGGLDWLTLDISRAMLIAGDTDQARELYLRVNPGWIDPKDWAQLISRQPQTGCIMSWILINTGEPELGQMLLEQSTTYLEHTLPAAIEHADRYAPDTCYLVAGDTEKALASLETQLAHGHIYSWPIDHHMPMYSLIELDPRYRELLAARDRRVAEQRELIEKIKL